MTAQRGRSQGICLVSAMAVALGFLAGCATPSPVPAPEAAPTVETPRLAGDAERALRERADSDMRARRWADALVQWELLALLKPDAQEYREQIEQTRRQIDATARSALAAAEQAQRSGNLERATVEYLRVLSVDRDNARAAQALREIERERTRRNYLNRPPRLVM
jgi:hypothetical protein